MPVPRLLKEGISEGQAKAVAEKATVYINKGLGEGTACAWVGGGGQGGPACLLPLPVCGPFAT